MKINTNKDKEGIPVTAGTNIFTTLQLIFLTLKLAGLVDWSWWFVFTPFFASIVISFIIIVVALIIFRD